MSTIPTSGPHANVDAALSTHDGHTPAGSRRVAIIGSFKQHYDAVTDALAAFRSAGWTVTSPAGTGILEKGIDFVRFESDDEHLSDAAVQSVTLRNIFSADLVYVIAPNGYVGRTTCYEIGRLVQAGRPIYLSHQPEDLPVTVPARFVAAPEQLVKRLSTGEHFARWCEEDGDEDEGAAIERELTRAHPR